MLYQNCLDAQNLPFAKACGNLLTNYCWKESSVVNSAHKALQEKLPLQHIYFGVDVWAQNVTKLSHPRVTYPEYGGGGTNTGVAVAKLAKSGFSAGIFAPAWTFEHFPDHGRDMEQTIWDGKDLPKGVTCSCGDCEKRHQPNQTTPITSFAKRFNAGSETFFFVDFNRAFGTHSNREKEHLYSGFTTHAQLGSQSVLPLRTESLGMLSPLRHYVEDVPGRTQLVIEARNLPLSATKKDLASTDHSWMIPLFRFDMPADGSLRLRLSYRDLSSMPQCVYFYTKVSGTVHGLVQFDYPRVDHLLDLKIGTAPHPRNQDSMRNLRLEEFGFYSNAFNAENGVRLVEVDYICIQPIASHPIPSEPTPYPFDMLQPVSTHNFSLKGSMQTHTILDIHMSSRGEGEIKHLRLCWSHTSEGQPVKGMPYSSITGPFAYFSILVDDLSLGRAYATEYVLPASLVEELGGCEVPVTVKGVGFDGQELTSASTTLQF